jgi:hypothetical protein
MSELPPRQNIRARPIISAVRPARRCSKRNLRNTLRKKEAAVANKITSGA